MLKSNNKRCDLPKTARLRLPVGAGLSNGNPTDRRGFCIATVSVNRTIPFLTTHHGIRQMKKHIAFLLTRSLLLTLAMVGLAGAEDAPQLQQINHTILSPNSEQIVLKLSGSYSPKTFTLKDQSPRVVLDFDDMTQGKGVRNLVTTDGPLLKGVRVGVHREGDPKTRVVVDLKSLKGVNYTQQFDEKTSTLTLRFTGPEKPEAKENIKQATVPQEKPAKTESAKATPPPAVKTAEEPKPAPPVTPVAEQPAAKTVPPVTAPPPPAQETVAKEVPSPASKEDKAGKKAEKTPPPAPAAEPKGSATPADKVASPAPPQAAPSPAGPQMPAVMTPPQTVPAPVAPAAPAAKEPAPPVAKEPPPAPAKETKESKEGKSPKKEEVKKGEETPAPAKDQAATSLAKPAPAEQAPPEAKQAADQTPPVLAAAATTEPELESIKFDPSSPKGEMIMFKLNGFHPPAVHGVEEGIPRVICDFNNTKLGSATKKQIKANGQHVKVIRTSVTKKPEKVRVVIDLEPNRSYDLQQVFFKDDNLFVIIVNTIGK